jgi:hypothetical protein
MNAARVAGLAAIAGGMLRIANAFLGQLPEETLAVMYFLTDMLLLTGVAGLWLARRTRMGAAGTFGLAIFVVGILTIRASAFGVGSYPLGAAIALLGLAAYSIDVLRKQYAGHWAPIFFLTSLPPAITAALGISPFAMSALAAALFGAGFIFTGIELLRASQMGT